MAALVEGTYAIISVRSGKALDVCGASDKSGTNVIQWNHTNGDAQIWSLSYPSVHITGDVWYIVSSLSGKYLTALNPVSPGTNVIQSDYRNSNEHYWRITSLNTTYTYKGTSYPVYTIHRAMETDPEYALDVAGNSAEPGANVLLWTITNETNQRWIFVPVPSLSAGTYKIGLAADVNMRVDITSSSKASSAKAIVWVAHDVDNQIFSAEADNATKAVRFTAAHSGLCLDIEGGNPTAGANVIQFPKKEPMSNALNQWWLPVQNGSITYKGQRYPTYEIRSMNGAGMVMDCLGGSAKTLTKIGIWPSNGKINQRFWFMKVERNAIDISTPGEINEKLFERQGNGSVTVSGLTFASDMGAFKARYMIYAYTAKRTQNKTVKSWTSIVNAGGTASTANQGWGDTWNSTFESPSVGGIVSMPLNISVSLDNTWQSAEVIVEVRAFNGAYTDRGGTTTFKAHGPIRRSVIKVVQKPNITFNGLSIVDDSSKNTIGISASISDSLNNGCERLRGRLTDANGAPISEWVSSSSMVLNFMVGDSLRRFPTNNESVTFEYSMLTPDGAAVNGSYTDTFTYSGTTSVQPTVSYLTDDSCTAVVSSTAHTYDFCIMEIPDTDGKTLVRCDQISANSSTKQWKIVPPLNEDVRVVVLYSANRTAWGIADLTCHINSHYSIWNWTDSASANAYDQYTSLVINSDKPPKQSRGYTTSMNFNSPSGRINPVAFSDLVLQTKLDVEGVVVDDDAEVYSIHPMPQHSSLTYIKTLVRLSGKGIHPIYRDPYGDWHYVGIESVDITKEELFYTSIKVNQRAVSD